MAGLVWSPRSLKDLEIINEYIKQDSVKQARKFVNELIYEMSTIIDFAYKGRLVPALNRDEVRGKIYKSYRIIYRLTETQIKFISCTS